MNATSRIEVLPDSVASAIAAGEVIERPASVIKELVENSLDAGATRIEIEIEGSGTDRMVVRDDGFGIRADDVVIAIERYATSKLRTSEDLFNIKTLGFRGEALSSIAAVSRFTMVTRSHEETRGTQLSVEGGTIVEKKPIGAPHGTSIVIRDLFYNVPARRKFIKSPRTERSRITFVVQRFALAFPAVSFLLMQEGRVVIETSGNGDERELLAKVFNLDIARAMLAIPGASETAFNIRGYISPPHINRSNRQGLTFFVNGRWVQDASLNAAALQAYHGLLMVGRYPISVIFLELPPDQVDVNVHPTKAEIRFREPQQVFSLVQRAVRASLLGQVSPPQVDLKHRWQNATNEVSLDWQLARQEQSEQAILPMSAHEQEGEDVVPLLRSVGQVSRAYLIAEGPDGIYLIDQHAAHERILFEAYMGELETDQLESQALLEPLTIEFSPDEVELIREHVDSLKTLGFQLEVFGGRTYRLRTIPSIFTGKDPEEAIRAVVEKFEEDEAPLASRREALLAARICKRLAIKSGQLLSLEEQRALLRALERCAAPRTCPHGRPTMIHLPVATLARQFGRT